MHVFDLLHYFLISQNRPIKKIGFDSGHVHLRVDIKLRSKLGAAKIFKAIIGRFVLSKFSAIKKEYFLGVVFGILFAYWKMWGVMKKGQIITLRRKNIPLINGHSTGL